MGVVKNRHLAQWNKTESPKIRPHIHDRRILKEVPGQLKRRKRSLLNKCIKWIARGKSKSGSIRLKYEEMGGNLPLMTYLEIYSE